MGYEFPGREIRIMLPRKEDEYKTGASPEIKEQLSKIVDGFVASIELAFKEHNIQVDVKEIDYED